MSTGRDDVEGEFPARDLLYTLSDHKGDGVRQEGTLFSFLSLYLYCFFGVIVDDAEADSQGEEAWV